MIVIGLGIGFFIQDKKEIVYLTSGAGLLIEFISGIFFYLYNKTVRQMKEYHDSLLDVQNILLCFTMLKDLNDEKDKLQIMKELINAVMEKKKTNY